MCELLLLEWNSFEKNKTAKQESKELLNPTSLSWTSFWKKISLEGSTIAISPPDLLSILC